MELDDIKRHALAARQFQVVHGEGTFTLTIPTRLQANIAHGLAHEPYKAAPRAYQAQFQRELLLVAITGWSGVALNSVVPDAGPGDELEFEKDAIGILLDADPDLGAVLLDQLLIRMANRSEALDSAEKN